MDLVFGFFGFGFGFGFQNTKNFGFRCLKRVKFTLKFFEILFLNFYSPLNVKIVPRRISFLRVRIRRIDAKYHP